MSKPDANLQLLTLALMDAFRQLRMSGCEPLLMDGALMRAL
jgi:hypothetical protein